MPGLLGKGETPVLARACCGDWPRGAGPVAAAGWWRFCQFSADLCKGVSVTAFFGCLYYAALRPEDATALRHGDCHLPAAGWGKLTLTTTAPRTAAAWTGNGT
jgi:hypothetical protein